MPTKPRSKGSIQDLRRDKIDNPELRKLALDAIRNTGCKYHAYKVLGMDARTFRKALDECPDFRQAYQDALVHYHTHTREYIGYLARLSVQSTLEMAINGDEVVEVEVREEVHPGTGEIVELRKTTTSRAAVSATAAVKLAMSRDFASQDVLGWVHQGVELGLLSEDVVVRVIEDVDKFKAQLRSIFEPATSPEISDPHSGDVTRRLAAGLGLLDTPALPNPVDS
jgi:hypothetical protein